MGRGKMPIFNFKFLPILARAWLFPSCDSQNTSMKADGNAWSIEHYKPGEVFKVCARYLCPENDTDNKKLQIKPQVFWTRKAK